MNIFLVLGSNALKGVNWFFRSKLCLIVFLLFGESLVEIDEYYILVEFLEGVPSGDFERGYDIRSNFFMVLLAHNKINA